MMVLLANQKNTVGNRMGISFRKSVKAGPFRINISKSGVGLSAGVKGLRVGVNAKGKGYVGGGVGGFTYRKNLGNAKSNRSIDRSDHSIEELLESLPKSQTTIVENILKVVGIVGIPVFPFIWGWFGFFFAIILIVTALVIESSRNAAIKFLENHLGDPFDESKLNAIKERIKKIKSISRDPNEILQKFLITHVKNSFADRHFSSEEKDLLVEFRSNLSPQAFQDSISNSFAFILLEAVEDQDFSEDEKKFLLEFLELVQLKQEMKDALDELILYFSEIEALRKADKIESITPSLGVGEANEVFYFETKVTLQKSKNVSEEGTILISDKFLHIYTGGHSKVKISDIIEMSCDQIAFGSLYITVKNRKTPLQLKCDDTLVALEFLRKLKGSID